MEPIRLSVICVLSLSVGLLGLPACGDDGGGGPSSAQIQQFCSTNCAKTAECGGLPSGFSEADCRTACVQAGQGATSSCEASEAQVDACLDALDNQTCAEFGNGTPECDELCDEGTNGGTPTGSCAALATCCEEIQDASQKQSCQAGAESNQQQNCSLALSGFEAAGVCGQGGGSACEDLDACCDELTDDDEKASCDQTVATGNGTGCSILLGQFQAAGTCEGGGGGTGCAELSECCEDIGDPNQKQGCDGLVAQGNDATCSAALSSFQTFCN